jgi:hypothetical protein
VEHSVAQVEARIIELLTEAQDARQWSIPWGARVELSFGPFVALRVFDLGGEFACHFLDDQDRYFPVALGLGGASPRASTLSLVRKRQDDGRLIWNEDGAAALKVIAAAIVRDFLVVEERESLFSSRNIRKRVRGHDVRSVIYLPRVRYTLKCSGGAHGKASPTESQGIFGRSTVPRAALRDRRSARIYVCSKS